MGVIRDYLDSRRARWRADTLKARADTRIHEKRIALAGKLHKSPAELIEQNLLESVGSYWGLDRTTLLGQDLDRWMDFGRGGFGSMGAVPQQRKNGADWPFFQSQQELGIYIMAARIAFGTITKAEGLIRGVAGYVLGDGVTVRVVPRDAADEPLAKLGQKVIDDFRQANEMDEREEEFIVKSRRDGEGIWRLFLLDDGTTAVRDVFPEQIRQPPDRDQTEWNFGIRCESGDVECRVEFAIFPTEGENVSEPDIVPDDEVIFFKCNTDRGVKRGLPDLAWGLLDAAKASDKLARNMGEGSAQQAAIAYIEQYDGVPAEAIRAQAFADADYTRTNPYTGQEQAVKQALPGTIVKTNKNVAFLGSPYNAGISSHLEVMAALDRVANAKYNAPEFLGSADASNNNFASALVSESPFVKRVKAFQRQYGRPFRKTHERVLAGAATVDTALAGILEKCEVKVTFPSPESRNKKEETDRATERLNNGTTSPQQVCEEDGEEWAKVVKDRAAAKKEGWEPPGKAAGQPGAGGAPGAGTPGQPHPDATVDNPHGPPVAESLTEAWSEEDHPRGDDGKFIAGEELVAAKSDPAKAAELRKQVTDPGERKKLDAAIGGDSAPAGHTVKLPANRAKLKIAQAAHALDQMGYKLGAPKFDVATKTATYEITKPDGSKTRATADEVKEIVYRGAKGGKPPTAPAKESLQEAILTALLEHGFTGTDRLGRRWEDGKEVKKDATGTASGSDKDSHDTPTSTTVPAGAPTASHVFGDVHDALPDEVKADPGVVAKVRRLVGLAYEVTWGFLATQGGDLIPEILDTADDYSSITYAKHGAQGQAQLDPFYESLGVPYSAVSVVVSKVIAAAAGYVKGKLTATEALEAILEALSDEQKKAVASGAAGLLAEVFKAWGLDADKVPHPTAEQIAARMGERSAASGS